MQGPPNGMGGVSSMHSNYGQYGYGGQQPAYMSRESIAGNGYNNGGHYGQNFASRPPIMGNLIKIFTPVIVSLLIFLIFSAVPPHPAERHALDLAGSREQRGSAFELYKKPQVGGVGHHHNLRCVVKNELMELISLGPFLNGLKLG